MEKTELGQFRQARSRKIQSLLDQFVIKQRRELAGMLKRVESGREEQRKARKVELQRLLQRYHNVKSQLESQQRIVRLRAEKYPLTSVGDVVI